jgi:hypothetical protein
MNSLPIPWTAEYQERRTRLLHAAVHDNDLLQCFADRTPLPARHGVGLDERIVEFPWLISRLPAGSLRMLDAGSALNHRLLLDHPRLAEKSLHIVTLAPEAECFWDRGISYLFEDLRCLPMRDDWYGVVASVSTLEHVGCDNAFYIGVTDSGGGHRLDDFGAAAGELFRVLEPGGQLLITVPYGRYQFHGAFQQFDRSRLTRLQAALSPVTTLSETFYRYDAGGWQVATDVECADREYVSWVSEYMRTRQWPSPHHEPDFAAAARAVACVAVTKRA